MAIFTNQATLTYQNTVTNSNIATGEILEAIRATKTAVSSSYTQGEDVTYAISIVNTGSAPLTGVTVQDDLGAYSIADTSAVPLSYVDGSVRVFVNGVLEAPPAVTTENGLVFSGITIPAGGNALILYEAVATAFASPAEGGVITNTAVVTADGLSQTVEASEEIFAGTGPNLSITKSINPAVVTENSRVTYSFVLQNFGNEAVAATGGAIVSDLFDPILTDLSVSYNGQSLTVGNGYQYNQATGEFTTETGLIEIPAASFSQDPTTGLWVTTPGVSTLTVTGTI